MKICVVMEFFTPYRNGGGEQRYYHLTKRLVEKGHTVDVLNMKLNNVPYHEVRDGINIYHIGPVIETIPIRSHTDFIKYVASVTKWLLTHDYDIIDAQSYSPLLPSCITSKIVRTPMIGTIHDVSTNNKDQWEQSSRTSKIAEKFLTNLHYNMLLTVSNATKDSLIKYFNVNPDRIRVLYNGVDLKKIDQVNCDKKDENTILFVGRLTPHKHVDHLLIALKEIRKNIPNIKLVVVGRGPDKENILNLIKEQNLEDNIEMLENLTDEELIHQMKKANILILPSTREGFGMVLAEANACYTPVIAYASGGVVEVVIDQKTGYLIEPENVEKLTQSIEKLLQDKQLQKEMGINGRRNVEENFNWDEITEDYLKLVEELVNK
jgi:glycosyltransferase involved in cell wall biosynthesis